MPSLQASFNAFATYHAAVAPVLGTDPAAVDAGLVEAALDAVLAKRPSPTSPEEHKAAYRHLRNLGEKNPLAFKLHYELHLKHQCNLAPVAITTESANVDDWKDDRICIKEKTMVGSVDVAAPTVLLTAIEPLATHAVITTNPRNTSPEDTSHTSGGGIEASNEGDCAGRKRSLRELREFEKQQAKWARKDGAIVAPTRKGEGYSLPVGSWLTCKPDAAYNGIKVLDPSFAEGHLAKLRRKAMPTLGNELEASWADLAATFATLGIPYEIVEATHRFQNAKGGPFLNLLDATAAVFLVALRVTVGGMLHKHCILVSTVRERHAPFGKMVDNHGKMRPVYIEKSDRRGKKAAHAAVCKLLRQHPSIGDEEFTVTTADIYELRKI